MIFENVYITTAGKEFLTRAVIGTKIHWDKCGCFTQNLNNSSQAVINALTNLTGPVALGSASAVFEETENDAGIARITCQVDNSEDGCSEGSAYSFGLWAKLESEEGVIDSNPTLIAVARTGSYTPTYFPGYTGTTTKLLGIVDLSITVQSGVASSISVSTSGYALAKNLQTEIDEREALEARVVTTHAESSTTTGESQVIFGEKSFIGSNFYVHNAVTGSSAIEIGLYNLALYDGIEINRSGITFYGEESIKSATDLIPLTNNAYDLGDNSHIWKTIYANNLGSAAYPVTTIYAQNIGAPYNAIGQIHCLKIGDEFKNVSEIFVKEINSSTDPAEKIYVDQIGSTDAPVSHAYMHTINCNDEYDLEVEAGSILLGKAGQNQVSIVSNSGNITTNGKIIAGDIEGKLPHPIHSGSSTTIPIGSIILCRTNKVNTMLSGEILTISTSTQDYTLAAQVNGDWAGGDNLPIGTYSVISSFGNASTSTHCIFLAMRLS